MMSKIVVGLSGGVDSSVAAASLCDQGYEVSGLTLWLMKGKGQCCSEGMVDAAHICEQLNTPHYIVDAKELFKKNIIDYLVSGYKSGITPLPCSQCNRSVKFKPMLDYAQQELDCDLIATGHYARIRYDKETDKYKLLRAIDPNKDQSYFLYDLPQDILAKTIFPLGEQTKEDTRRMATEFKLRTANKPESQDLCLIESYGSMASFLEKYIKPQTGDIVNSKGEVLGTHKGIHNYTIGQRKGLGISSSEPLYVLKLNLYNNQVVVGNRTEGFHSSCIIKDVNWISISKPDISMNVKVQVRYRSLAVSATIIPVENNRYKLIFEQSQFGITAGQAAVLYDDDIVLAGGIIEEIGD